MNLSRAAAAFALAASVALPKASVVLAEALVELPEINEIINVAFPMWEVDGEGKRTTIKECKVDDCEWNPFYVTKRYDGLHPDFGGHPTDNDTRYPFFASSPFDGQPYPGTPHHCPPDASDDIKAKDCPKIVTTSDSDAQGPGHVPPHISLAALTWAVRDSLFTLEEMFDYEKNNCLIAPQVLFQMVREYYPRTEGEAVKYPPPITTEGGDFQYEFPSGNGLDKQEPPYAPGPPHWCTEEMTAAGHWDGVCPYIFEGPDAGKYRHPHIALAALEVYLANMHMPGTCAKTWLENNPDFLDPERVTTDTPFPVMSNDDADAKTVENWLGQPVLPWKYDSGDARPGAKIMRAEDTADLLVKALVGLNITEPEPASGGPANKTAEEPGVNKTEPEPASGGPANKTAEEPAEDPTPSSAFDVSAALGVPLVALVGAILA